VTALAARELRARARRRVVTALGLRFWDPALDCQVTDALRVIAIPLPGGEPRIDAYRTPSGIYAFHGLPGLRTYEYPQDDAPPTSPPLTRTFLIQVLDGAGRFLPTLLRVAAPFSGVYPTGLATGSPASGPPGLYLFSAPTRNPSSGPAVIRAQLAAVTAGGTARPAAHAVLEVYLGGTLLQLGIADPQGSVAIFMPYPAFAPSSPGSVSPPTAATPRQSWTLGMRARFQPSVLNRPAGPLPELRSIVAQTAAPFLVPDGVGVDQPVAELTADLVFGQELVLRTGTDARLFLGSAATSP
jgi:hypothetical protein